MPTDAYRTALALALRRLQSADRFEAEIRALLSEFDAESVERVIQTLRERRILDDRRTTRAMVERRSGRRSVGSEKIRAELVARGAPEEIVADCLAELTEDGPERMRVALAAKFKPTDSRVKGARFLLSRGFGEDEIESALDAYFGTE